MKKQFIYSLTATLLLTSCINDSSSSEISAIESESSISENSSSSSEESIEIDVPSVMVGTWYVHSSNMGEIPVNGIFTINENKTLDIGQRTLSLYGNYENYEDSYEFIYGTIHFIVSYDEDHKMIDWGYQNGNTYDMGTAGSEPLTENTYEYEGAEYPMNKINEYLGTSGNVPAFEADYYYLDLFSSSYASKAAMLEIDGTTTTETATYIQTLIDAGYTFYKEFGGTVTAGTFYVGYDSNKIYTLRIIYYSEDKAEDCETDIFYYAYSESIKS